MIPIRECPHCKANLDGDDIFECFLQLGHSREIAAEKASFYGWTPENKQKYGREISIYDRDEDRTVRYMCPDCTKEWSAR